MTLANQRHLFDIPDGVTYLNCAAQSPSLRASDEAGRTGLARKLHPWDPERANLYGEIAEARRLFGGLIGASAETIALMTSTSYGAAIGAANLGIQSGQRIVVLQNQFPSNYYAWANVAERDGGTVTVVARPHDGDWTRAVLDQIDADTGLVALPNCHWMDGGVIDLGPVADRVHKVGAGFFIDATQSVGVKPFDVARLDPDFVACSAYKWLLSPDGVGFLYVAPRHLDGRPIENNHASRIADTSMELASGYGDRYLADAARFDQGAADSMVHMPMTVAALRQISSWGVAEIEAALAPLVDRIAAAAAERGWRVPPEPHRARHMIGLGVGDPPDGLIGRLKAEGVYVSLRGGAIRVSPYLFNDETDVDRLFEALDRLV